MRKNVLILGHDYTGPFIDVVNQYTYLFNKEKFSVTVAYLTGEPDDGIKHRTLGEDVIFLNIPKKKIRSLKIGAIKTLLALTRKMQFEIVICHRYKPSYIMLWVAQFYKIPVLISVMHELRTMSSFNRQVFIAAFARNNVLFAGVSNAVRNDMRKNLWFMPKDKIVTLYNTIEVQTIESEFFTKDIARQSLGLASDDFIFGNLGRLVKNKDQQTLIRAFAQIKSYCPKAKLVIVGTGELEDQLKQLITSLGLENEVLLTGFLIQGFRYMKAFDCFVLSSIQEAFGRVLLEAMAAKLPIIATRVHGVPEVIDEAGFLVEAKEVNDLAGKMREMYEMSELERTEWGEKAYRRVNNHFSISHFREKFWELNFTL